MLVQQQQQDWLMPRGAGGGGVSADFLPRTPCVLLLELPAQVQDSSSRDDNSCSDGSSDANGGSDGSSS